MVPFDPEYKQKANSAAMYIAGVSNTQAVGHTRLTDLSLVAWPARAVFVCSESVSGL